MKNVHITVLLNEIVNSLDIQKGDKVVDGTLGAGGHTLKILQDTQGQVSILGIDLDQQAITRTKARLKDAEYGNKVQFFQGNFSQIQIALQEANWDKADKVILDLGFSSNQLEEDGRGFSFLKDEPLIMTLSNNAEDITAFDIVNHWSEETIADILYLFGEEQFSRRIARGIVSSRSTRPIHTTFELVEIVKSSVPVFYKRGKINPATKTFQAIRIAVNRELENLKEFLAILPACMKKGGRVAIISFHSLEDRIVKQTFLQMEEQGLGKRLTKKPIVPSEEELRANPRARSAKQRVFEFN